MVTADYTPWQVERVKHESAGNIAGQETAPPVTVHPSFVGTTQQKTPLRVLIIEDSEFDARILVNTLRQGGYQPSFQRVDTAEALRAALKAEQWDIILSDYNIPDVSAPAAFCLARRSSVG